MATLRLPHFDRGGPHPKLDRLRAVLWALAGAFALLGIFAAALGGLEPADAEMLAVVAGVTAVVWAAHAWLRLWEDERNSGG